MQSIHHVKRGVVTPAPLLLFDCALASGEVEHWSTHSATVDGTLYEARVLRHNALEFRGSSDDGIDAVSRVSLTLANADSRFSQIARTTGWKGARLNVRFVFFDVTSGSAVSECTVIFQGVGNPPDEITESTIRLTFNSRMNLQRLALPEVRIQRRCPWIFPSNPAQRAEAVNGGLRGRYSPFYKCGYSPDQTGGCGNTTASGPYTSCDYTRAQCEERGMFDKDMNATPTRRFGGIEFVPSTINVKTYGDSGTHSSEANANESKYNDFVPLIYGTVWYRPPVVFARNDGNLTRMEVLLGMGEIEGVLKVVVSGIELPAGATARNATATGWYGVVTHGQRSGGFNLDFTGGGRPAGDPYGSMAMMSVVVPTRISDGSPIPTVEVLVQGQRLPIYDEAGIFTGSVFTNNPAWVLLDLARRTGWTDDEIDIPSFARTAAYCSERIHSGDLNGNEVEIPRFQCNLLLRRRRSAADVIRGVRNGSALYMTYGSGGRLQLHPETSLAIQQADRPASTNSTSDLNGGWPAYEFGDGTPFSDILLRSNGEPSLRVWCRSTAETPNRLTAEFQDEFNEYQQDSLSLSDFDDTLRAGQEVSMALPALGLPNFNQAARVMRLALDRSIRGNTYVDFDTGVRGVGLKPGDLITITYAKEGLDRQPFRIVRVAPTLNAQTTSITAQWHDDLWYDGETGAQGSGRGREVPSAIGTPRPLLGSRIDAAGNQEFDIEETYRERTDGSWDVDLSVKFTAPAKPAATAGHAPRLSLAARAHTTGGSLKGGRSYYYAVTAITASGDESGLSFTVRAVVPEGTDTNTVTLTGLSFAQDTKSFRVYRGSNPSELMRIGGDRPVSDEFTDDGKSSVTGGPPDANYDHANFYWRYELVPEHACTTHTGSSISSDRLSMLPNEYRGKAVRIVGGKGVGQERTVASNTAEALTITSPWTIEPDTTSRFVVADSSWTFGAVAPASPVVFAIPNRQRAGVHICGRSANVNDRECAYELSPMTRHTIGGAAGDGDVPDVPLFGLRCVGRGTVDVTAIGFENLANTRSVTAATVSLHTWDELAGSGTVRLATALTAEAQEIVVGEGAAGRVGALVQLGPEVVVIKKCSGATWDVQRGAYGTKPAEMAAGAPVYLLERTTHVLPFVKGFFGTPASGSYAHSITLPCRRIVVAEMHATNARGNSQVKAYQYADLDGGGLRTLSGGQIALQVDGPLTVQSNAVPALTCDVTRSVRDVYARINEAPVGGTVLLRVTRNGQSYCDISIVAGQNVATAASEVQHKPLRSGDTIGLDVVGVPQGTGSVPGSSLTVTVRF